MNKQERDALVTRLRTTEERLYPEREEDELQGHEFDILQEEYYEILGEYFDRLPRMSLSVCPHCQAPLKRTIDPFGLDGPWWYTQLLCDIEEPEACSHFRVLLGALSLHGRQPVEVIEQVQPGPAVPYVIPRLLKFPTMIAVISMLTLPCGSVAYPIAYFSEEEISPIYLHQPWCRTTMWIEMDGEPAWSIATDIWEFNLTPYLTSGKLRWIEPNDVTMKIRCQINNEVCPFLDLSGDRFPQLLSGGERELLPLPNGEPWEP